jgi:DNA-binding transcriptional ArsR family regulator
MGMNTHDAAQCLEALGSPTRLEIYRLLVQAGPGGAVVGDLQARLDIPASTLSHHLSRLVRVGLISQERQSRNLVCRANYVHMNVLLAYLSDQCCQGLEDAPCGTAGAA